MSRTSGSNAAWPSDEASMNAIEDLLLADPGRRPPLPSDDMGHLLLQAQLAPPPQSREVERAQTLPFGKDANLTGVLKTLVKSLSQAVDRRLSPFDLTEAQALPLLCLADGRCHTPGELARLCDYDTGALVRSLDRMEAKGLLTRVRSVEDRRVVEICLTDRGRKAAAQVPGATREVLESHLSDFSADDRRMLLGLLLRMRANAAVANQRLGTAPSKSRTPTNARVRQRAARELRKAGIF